MDEGRDEGLIEFVVWGEAVEVEDEGFEVEWGIEADPALPHTRGLGVEKSETPGT